MNQEQEKQQTEAQESGLDPQPHTDAPEESDGYNEYNPKHSGVGIASFILAILSYAAAIAMVFLAAPALNEMFQAIGPDTPTSMVEQQIMEIAEAHPGLAAAFALLIAGGGACLIGFILGLIGIFSKNKKKLFAILGTLFTGLPIGALFLLIAVGMLSGG